MQTNTFNNAAGCSALVADFKLIDGLLNVYNRNNKTNNNKTKLITNNKTQKPTRTPKQTKAKR